MRTHVQLVGWLHLALGVLDLFLALAVFGIFTGAALFAGLAQAGLLAPLAGTVGVFAGGLVALTALPNLLAGWGVLRRASWARILTLVLALLNVFKFPWGTALGAYTFWVLTDDGVEESFREH